ncbi:MAG: hypothetical protein LRY73_16650 [Bacillus sp. (in: Bacteria)]|nr:hypothetical protein [Bacillus sp. (in: firmicutes)]
MPKTVAKDFLELINQFIQDKLLFVAKTTEDQLEVIKVMDNNTGIPLSDEETAPINDTY